MAHSSQPLSQPTYMVTVIALQSTHYNTLQLCGHLSKRGQVSKLPSDIQAYRHAHTKVSLTGDSYVIFNNYCTALKFANPGLGSYGVDCTVC